MADALVRSPADLAGKKIRIPSRTGAWVVEALGASPVKTSVGEIPTALAKKVVDGALIPFEIIPPFRAAAHAGCTPGTAAGPRRHRAHPYIAASPPAFTTCVNSPHLRLPTSCPAGYLPE